MTVKVYDDAGTCVMVHEARSDLTGSRAVLDALRRAYGAEVSAPVPAEITEGEK